MFRFRRHSRWNSWHAAAHQPGLDALRRWPAWCLTVLLLLFLLIQGAGQWHRIVHAEGLSGTPAVMAWAAEQGGEPGGEQVVEEDGLPDSTHHHAGDAFCHWLDHFSLSDVVTLPWAAALAVADLPSTAPLWQADQVAARPLHVPLARGPPRA